MKSLIDQQRNYFNTNATKPLSFRKQQLIKLRSLINEYEPALTAAVFKDFQKGTFNTVLTEFSSTRMDLNKAIKKLGKWAKIKRVGTNMVNFPGSSYIFPEPLGVC